MVVPRSERYGFRRNPMKRYALAALAVGLLIAADKKDDAVKKDLDQMTGTWVVVSSESNGVKLPAEDVNKWRLVQKGEEWAFYEGDKVLVAGKDKIDPGRTPKQVTVTLTAGPDKGKTVLGIYEIDGDTWKTCWADPGKERPTAFATKPDSGQHSLVLKRVKAK